MCWPHPGSVVPLFNEQIKAGGPVTVTHPEVIRYFMTIPEAAQLVIQAGSMADGGDVFVLDMGKPVRIGDLARRMIHLMGLTVRDEQHPDGDIEISYTGLRPAEKLYEELLIGNNVTGTEHPMILRAIEHSLPWERVQTLLDEILAAMSRFDCQRALQLLGEVVEEYKPAPESHDLVWARQSAVTVDDRKVTSLKAATHCQKHRAHRYCATRKRLSRPLEGVMCQTEPFWSPAVPATSAVMSCVNWARPASGSSSSTILGKGFRQAVTAGELMVGDVGDYALVSRLLAEHRVDTVMHFAAHTIVPESVALPLKYYGNNTCSTRSLLQACIENGVKNFVFSSTAAVYGMPEDGYADEESPTRPDQRLRHLQAHERVDAARCGGGQPAALRGAALFQRGRVASRRRDRSGDARARPC